MSTPKKQSVMTFGIRLHSKKILLILLKISDPSLCECIPSMMELYSRITRFSKEVHKFSITVDTGLPISMVYDDGFGIFYPISLDKHKEDIIIHWSFEWVQN